MLPGLRIAAAASLGAGAVHAAAAGVHAEHVGLARIFVVLAALQLAAGGLALLRPSRIAGLLIAAVNSVAVAGWALTRVTGISWIDGLQARESPQFADAACAALGALAVAAAVAAALIGWQRDDLDDDTQPAAAGGRSMIMVSAAPLIAIAALAVPAMLLGGTSVHDQAAASEHDHGTSSPTGSDPSAAAAAAAAATAAGHDHEHTDASGPTTTFDESQPHTHDANGNSVAIPTSTIDESQPHAHDANGNAVAATATTTAGELATDGTPVRPWPRAWDPAQPIDVGGVPGVTPDQEARATRLIQGTLADLPKYADPAAAVADGYASIGDAGTGSEHFIKLSLIQDTSLLDPTAPESLVYDVGADGTRTLAGAMYIASSRPLDDPSLTNWAGPLMTWHEHNNLCWSTGADGKPKVVGLTDADGNCARGAPSGGDTPMVHVWIVPRPCGVFSALEGVGAGTTAVAADQRTDTCSTEATAHTHTGTAGAASTTAAVPSLSYDPTKPIDLSGVAGVTPEQQAAAENLVAINVVRLPQWADYHTAEAAGYHSIGDAGTGFEHFIKWDSINDQVALDPDHPESLVYTPQPDGSKKLVSAMYMLPSTVALTDVPDIGGALMQWHIHDNLCFTTDPVAPQVVGLTDAAGGCRAGLRKLDPAPMIHVWIVPNKCGPFSALEGVGAGQVAAGQTTACDHVHGDGLLG